MMTSSWFSPRSAGLVTLLVAVVALITSAAFGGGSTSAQGGQKAGTQISTKGKRVHLGVREAARMRRSGIGPIFRMAVNRQRVFYRFVQKSGDMCYGTGKVGDGPGFGVCWAMNEPIMDLSLIEITRLNPEPRIIRAEGIASDSIATVVLVGAEGQDLAQTTVTNNTYHFRPVPTAPVKAIHGLDLSGVLVYTHPIGPE